MMGSGMELDDEGTEKMGPRNTLCGGYKNYREFIQLHLRYLLSV